MIKNLLIIGGSGFLGRNLVKHVKFVGDMNDIKIFITGHSESKISLFKKVYPEIPVTKINIDNLSETSKLDHLIQIHSIDTVIHTAAMKHVDICQDNIVDTLFTNVIFVQNLITICRKNNVPRLLGISTDKANNPLNVYGMSKYMMEKLVLQSGYQIYQGVNFFWSDGSVLDIWFHQYKLNKPLTYRDLESYRYYNLIDHVCQSIIEQLTDSANANPPEIITTGKVYRISLGNLLKAFMEYFDYHQTHQIAAHDYEKTEEELIVIPGHQIDVIEPNLAEVKQLLDHTYTKIIS